VTHYGIGLRLHFIDVMLQHYGTLNRVALMDYFGISTPQASNDIKVYLGRCPGNMVYDKSLKTYTVCSTFKAGQWR